MHKVLYQKRSLIGRELNAIAFLNALMVEIDDLRTIHQGKLSERVSVATLKFATGG